MLSGEDVVRYLVSVAVNSVRRSCPHDDVVRGSSVPAPVFKEKSERIQTL